MLPVHAVKDSAQVLERKEKQGAGRASRLQVQSQALPACPACPGRSKLLFSPRLDRRTLKCMNIF